MITMVLLMTITLVSLNYRNGKEGFLSQGYVPCFEVRMFRTISFR